MNIIDHTTYSSGGDIPSKADLTQCSLSTFKSLCFINDGSHMVNHYSKERRERSECDSPLGPKGEEQHSPAVKGVGGPNSNDWTESLALCVPWERDNASAPVLIDKTCTIT
jgi:hypothetical protein